MFRIVKVASIVGASVFLLSSPAMSQLDLPRPSPAAKVSQVIGLTEVSVEYSQPGGQKPQDLGRSGAL